MVIDFPIEAGLKNDPSTPAADMLAKGVDIYYSDDRFPDPDLVVRESPDGIKTLLRFNGTDFEAVKSL